MPTNTPRRESIDTTGLVVLKHSVGLTPQGRAADAAGWPTSAADEDQTEERFEIKSGRTVQSVHEHVVALIANYRAVGDRGVVSELETLAAMVWEIEETHAELLARTGLDEGDRLETRFPTVAEDRAKLAQVLAAANGRVA